MILEKKSVAKAVTNENAHILCLPSFFVSLIRFSYTKKKECCKLTIFSNKQITFNHTTLLQLNIEFKFMNKN